MGRESAGTGSIGVSWAERRLRRLLGAVVVLVGALAFGLAVGSAGPSSAATTPTWQGAGAPLPHDADPGNQAAVLATSCPAPGTCVGVGAYVTGSRALGLVEIEVGGAWQPTAVTAPTGAATNPLEEPTAVDCTSVTACVAVGIYRDSGGRRAGDALERRGDRREHLDGDRGTGTVRRGGEPGRPPRRDLVPGGGRLRRGRVVPRQRRADPGPAARRERRHLDGDRGAAPGGDRSRHAGRAAPVRLVLDHRGMRSRR